MFPANSSSLATVDAVQIDLPVAGIGSRAYAFVIDWHIRALAALLWLGAAALAQHLFASMKPSRLLLLWLPAGLIYLLYHPVLETLFGGRTPGKRMAGLRVVTRDGHIPPPGTHLARNLFRMLDSLPLFYGLGLLTMVLNLRQCRIGDLASGTLVVFNAPHSRASLEVLSKSGLPPRLALLTEELLQRWTELDPQQRLDLSAQLLLRAGVEAPANGGEEDRRLALRALLDDATPAAVQQAEPLVQRWLKKRSEAWSRIGSDLQAGKPPLPLAVAQQRVRDYREVARDISLARHRLRGSGAVERLEGLFRELHALLHRDYEPWRERLHRLYASEVPQAFHAVRGAVLAVAALFVGSALAAFWLVHTYPELASLFASERMIRTVEKGSLWTEQIFSVTPAPVASTRIITNNVTVSLFAFVLGTIYGLGTIYLVALNGAMLGALFAFTGQHGMAGDLLRFVVPHGVVELSVIILSAAAGLRLGEALVRPGTRSRSEALAAAVGEAGTLLAVVVPGLLVAGIIEGFVSPDADAGWPLRLLAAGCSGFLLWAALVGRLIRPPRPPGQEFAGAITPLRS